MFKSDSDNVLYPKNNLPPPKKRNQTHTLKDEVRLKLRPFTFRYVCFHHLCSTYNGAEDYPALDACGAHFCTEINEHAERRANRNHSQRFLVHL